jgi:hypothetical protein
LLARLTAGENAGRMGGDPSSAGARSAFQFIPSTREDFVSRFGLDPWKNADESARSAIIHLMGRGGAYGGGLAGYNPGGGQAYVDYILGQRVAGFRDQGVGVRGGGGGSGRGGGRGASVVPASVSREQVVPGGAGLAGLISALAEEPPQAPSGGGPTRPEFAAGPVAPEGYRPVPAGAPREQGRDVDELMALVSSLEGPRVARSTVTPGRVVGGGRRGRVGRDGKGGGGLGGVEIVPDGWKGTKLAIEPARRIAAGLGIGVSSEKRPTERTASGNVSDHFEGNTSAYALDLDTPGDDSREGHRLARRIAKAYGVRYRANSYSSGGEFTADGRRYRIQILYGSGVDHGDHVHVGVARL